jgi:serine/threonine-protein kinase
VQTAHVLLQIASGLSEVEDIVHRDLKPANILRHEGVWKIADFGIAKFVEETTSVETLKKDKS